ncbi:3-hydroxybutyrate dehydrogenase [Shouchella clausii]|uniref:3-hydroxybutyrate dehydrogenase n=1 Tax=Shouchella clausii TaxID=79880 RepID=UPI000B99F861|nr:3-hydroxybutyrate dehydrogenase [Shouchella clausii]AST96355.1 3-hydroxybutyrate dehydrogenase [Shouchella clausii]MCR1287667.1 3-hydroxybutyrate dehydrogenase [Shouchella clausii]MEB5471286.1 3-hydroxybutyrate dehydrogenase [Shouchella clausii]QNM42711.1 3-hydroxybutyrate dehydrogenase [Shouchella clausii]WQG97406.1 3-hydroxybutyrate dehydrogenase [Shouchella clausii]
MMKGTVVLITGAASGIGYHLAQRFAAEGASVMVADVHADSLHKATLALTEKGYVIEGIQTDVTNENEVKAMVQKTVACFGRIDVLINNAGMQHVSPIEDFPTETYKLLVDIMLVGPFMAMKHVMPIMRKQQFGRIINMSSINGLIGFSGKAAYNSAKHGIIGLSKVAALETAEDGITVNCIAPGYIDTPLVRNQMEALAKSRQVPIEKVLDDVIYPLVPQKRLITVEEVASLAMYLSSAEAKGITGQTLVVDGGYTVQ